MSVANHSAHFHLQTSDEHDEALKLLRSCGNMCNVKWFGVAETRLYSQSCDMSSIWIVNVVSVFDGLMS